MKIVLSHPTANASVRAITKALSDAGMLHTFFTSIASFPDGTQAWYNNIKLLNELNRRSFDASLKQHTKLFPWREIGRILSNKLGVKSLTKAEVGPFCIDKCYHAFDRFVAKSLKNSNYSDVKGAYAYEDGAFSTFKAAKERDIACIYDLPIAYWETTRRLMYEESLRLPDWLPTFAGSVKDSDKKLERKQLELELADVVVVASKFVGDSLPQWASGKKIILAPFGTPSENSYIDLKFERPKDVDRPLRVLFAGSLGQRKGLADLFSAMKLLKGLNVELVVMGSLQAPMEFYTRQLPNFTYEAGRPHKQVLELMRTCDVFCLPSIVEGRALVMQEAMSQGLPIIITPNTGGEDLIIESETGFLVPIKSPQKIAEKINWFLENRDKVAEMGQKAKNHARQYTWDKYCSSIIDGINTLLK